MNRPTGFSLLSNHFPLPRKLELGRKRWPSRGQISAHELIALEEALFVWRVGIRWRMLRENDKSAAGKRQPKSQKSKPKSPFVTPQTAGDGGNLRLPFDLQLGRFFYFTELRRKGSYRLLSPLTIMIHLAVTAGSGHQVGLTSDHEDVGRTCFKMPQSVKVNVEACMRG